MQKKHRVVIVGGGFGGIKAALELASEPQVKVTLISDKPVFRYYPTLYRTVTGGSRVQSLIPLSEIFKDTGVRVIIANAHQIDRQRKEVIVSDGQDFAYDTLVMALGVVTNYFGIKGLKHYSYGMKSFEEANELKQHLHDQLISQHKPDFNYLVIGGGPTGVELAGALPAYIRRIMKKHGIKHRAVRIGLVEATPRLLPRMPKDVSRVVARRLRRLKVKLYLNKKVEGETIDSLIVDDEPIKSRTVIWTAGVTNHPFFKANHFLLNQNGRVRVDQYLQAEENIYVIGDNADTPYSGMAQTAVHDGAYVGGTIKSLVNGQSPRVYKPKRPIYVTPVGAKWAATLWGNVRVYGRLSWALRRLADFVAYHDVETWWRASRRWQAEYEEEETCPYCS
jgi:NADH dehydrogenase